MSKFKVLHPTVVEITNFVSVREVCKLRLGLLDIEIWLLKNISEFEMVTKQISSNSSVSSGHVETGLLVEHPREEAEEDFLAKLYVFMVKILFAIHYTLIAFGIPRISVPCF